jgi:ribosomal protein S13
MPDFNGLDISFDELSFDKDRTGVDRNAKHFLQDRGYLEKDGDYYNFETDDQIKQREIKTERSRRDFIKNPSLLKTLGRGFSRGVDNLQASAYGLSGLFGDLVGSEGLKDFGLKGFSENQKEASETYVPIDSFISGGEKGAFGSAGNFITAIPQAIGEALPSILEAVTFSAAGAVAGSQVVPGIGPDDLVAAPAGAVSGIFAKGAIKKYIRDLANKEGIEIAAAKALVTPQIEKEVVRNAVKSLSAKVGGGLAIGLTEAGSNFAELSRDHGIDAPMTSLLFGLVSGASESMFGAVPDIMKQFMRSPISHAVKQKAKESGMKKAMGWMFDVMKSSAAEGGQEAFQGFLSSLNKEVNDPNFEITSKETFMEWMEQAAAGALVGGPLRIGSKTIESFRERPSAPVKSEIIPGENGIEIPTLDMGVVANQTDDFGKLTPEAQTKIFEDYLAEEKEFDEFRAAELNENIDQASVQETLEEVNEVQPQLEDEVSQEIIPESNNFSLDPIETIQEESDIQQESQVEQLQEPNLQETEEVVQEKSINDQAIELANASVAQYGLEIGIGNKNTLAPYSENYIKRLKGDRLNRAYLRNKDEMEKAFRRFELPGTIESKSTRYQEYLLYKNRTESLANKLESDGQSTADLEIDKAEEQQEREKQAEAEIKAFEERGKELGLNEDELNIDDSSKEQEVEEPKQSNPYLNMPIEKVKADAEHGVLLATEALEILNSKKTTEESKSKEDSPAEFNQSNVKVGDIVQHRGGSFEVIDVHSSGVSGKRFAHLPFGGIKGLNPKPDPKKKKSKKDKSKKKVEEVESNKSDDLNEVLDENGSFIGSEEIQSKSNKPESNKKNPDLLQDFGEVIPFARKHEWQDYAKSLDVETDVKALPLSKALPKPNYKKMVSDGVDKKVVGLVRAIRESIPNKPRRSHRISNWVSEVNKARRNISNLISGEITPGFFEEKLFPPHNNFNKKIFVKSELYKEFGHDVDLSDLRIESGSYSVFKGEVFDNPKSLDVITMGYSGSGNMSTADNLNDVIEKFKTEVMPNLLDKPKSKKKGPKFDIRMRRRPEEGQSKYYINHKIGRNYIPVVESNDLQELKKAMSEDYDYLVSKLEEIKKIPEMRMKENRIRVGDNFRENSDVSPDEFQNAFGFRGVQFGNSMTQKERQSHLNETYDALMDLSSILKIPARSISLNGELAMAFGARGRGGKNSFAAHFEPGQVVINLTRKNGAGSLAHEWFHAMDNYFAKKAEKVNGTYQTSANGKIREEVRKTFNDLVQKIMSSPLVERSKDLDKLRSKPYWSTTVEMAARTFESYIIKKLNDQGFSNDYLANISNDAPSWNGKYPYLLKEEIPEVEKAFDNLFDSIEVKETDGGIELYRDEHSVVDSVDYSELNRSDKAKIVKLVKRMTGTKNVSFSEKLISPEGKEVMGRYKDSFIEISEGKGNAEDTARHEAMHFAYDLLLTEQEAMKFDQATLDLGLTHEQAIEKINEFSINSQTSLGKLKVWANRLLRRIKMLFGKESAIDVIEDIYDRALAGKLAERGETGLSNYEGVHELFRSEEALEKATKIDGGRIAGSWDFALKAYENFKQPNKKEKGDLGIFDRVIRSISFFSEKVPALKRIFDSGNKLRDDKVLLERLMFNEANGKGESNFESLVKYTKENKEEWKKLQSDYLWKRDIDQIGYRVVESKDEGGKFSIINPEGKKVFNDIEYGSESKAWHHAFLLESGDMKKSKKWSDEAIQAVLDIRKMMTRQHDMLLGNVEKLKESSKKFGVENPVIGDTNLFDLFEELKKMGDLRGSYMPRLRTGQQMLWARKEGENPRLELFDTRVQRSLRAAKLRKEGYTIENDISGQPSQDAFLQGGNIAAINDLVNNALLRAEAEANNLSDLGLVTEVEAYKDSAGRQRNNLIVSGQNAKKYSLVLESFGGKKEGDKWIFRNKAKDRLSLLEKSLASAMHNQDGARVLEFEAFGKALAEQMAVMFHSRGSRARKISRDGRKGKDVFLGFEEDALRAVSMSVRATAGGTAKRNMTRDMVEAITGRDLKWKDFLKEKLDPSIVEGTEEYYDAKTKLWPEYRKAVIDRSIESDKQPRAFKEALHYMQDMQRNEEGSERVFGKLRALAAFKYLSGVSSGLINLTALGTVVPGAMSQFGGINIRKSGRLIASAGRDYTKYMMYHKYGKGKDLTGEQKFVFDEITKRGWDSDLMNEEALNVTRNWGGKLWNNILEKSLIVFSVTERLNRASTIAAAYNGLVDKHEGELTDSKREEFLKLSKRIADKAHGIYGKANLPAWARGSGGGQIGRAFYMYQTFTHNYIQLLSQSIGSKDRDLKAAAWMMLSPGILAGASASVLLPMAQALASVVPGFEEPDDLEEAFYQFVEEYAGEKAEEIARFGVAGQFGVSLKGSLAVRTELPTTIEDVGGASISAAKDVFTGIGQIFSGNIQKGFESISPKYISTILKSHREYTEGVTNSKDQPVYFGDERLKASTSESLWRFFGFNPVGIAEKRERQWKDFQLEKIYRDRKSSIYNGLRRFILNGGSQADWLEHLKLIEDYNAKVLRTGNSAIPQITPRSVRGVMESMKKGNRREALRAKELSGEIEERELADFSNFNIEERAEGRKKSRSNRRIRR